MRRREFLGLLGGATGYLLVARAQQGAIPVVGFLASLSSAYVAHFTPAFRAGLSETGYIDGQNVLIEFRSAEGQYDRLPGLATELLERKVAVIVAIGGSEPAKVAKAATTTIPIVFVSAADPVRAGIVTSFNRPGGNITGVSLLGSALEAKRLELLHQMVPGDSPIGVLLNPKYPDFDLELRELEEAAKVIDRKIIVARASTQAEVEAALTMIIQQSAIARFWLHRTRSLTANATIWLDLPLASSCPRSTISVNKLRLAVCLATGPILLTGIDRPVFMSGSFSRVPSQAIFRFCSRPNMSL
jgi:putative tryptophan/tyrosine transport system substrate-binding protein